MTEVLPDFTLLRPDSIAAAIAAFEAHPDARYLAGGSDLLVNIRHGLSPAKTLIDLGAIAALKVLDEDDAGLHIGAGVSLATLADAPQLGVRAGAIREAARSIAGPTHRNVATLGGNLCLDTRCLYYNQSDWWRQSNGFCLKYRGDICHVAPRGDRCRAAFSGDLAPALILHRAEVALAGPKGSRRLPLEEFYIEDGAAPLALEAGEIVTGVHLARSNARSTYGKIRIRGAMDFPLAGVAVACEDQNGAHLFRLAFTGTNSCPVLARGVPVLEAGQTPDAYFAALEKLVQKTVSPQRTTTTQPHYRRLSVAAVASRLARRLLA